MAGEGGRAGRALGGARGEALDRRISRSMESVETIVSHLATLRAPEGGARLLSASSTELGPGGPRRVPALAPAPGPRDPLLRRLAGGWTEHRHAASGRLLYHQAAEGLASWKPPRGLAAPPGYTGHYTDTAGGGRIYYTAQGTGTRWDTARDSAGRRYYYTEEGDSEWSLPALSPDLSPTLSAPPLAGQVSAVQGRDSGSPGTRGGARLPGLACRQGHHAAARFTSTFRINLCCTVHSGASVAFQTSSLFPRTSVQSAGGNS
jgi:hypothetical protein